MTLLQYWTQNWFKEKETAFDKLYNPLGAKIGDAFAIDWRDCDDGVHVVSEMLVFDGEIVGGASVQFVDYIIDRTLRTKGGDESKQVCLRVARCLSKSQPFDLLLLKCFRAESPYSKELRDAVNDPTGEFVITHHLDDGDVDCRYWLQTHYKATVSDVKDANGDKKIDDNEIKKLDVEGWRFSRMTEDVAKQQIEEFVIVEEDLDCHTQSIWIGEIVPAVRVRKM